jgi:cytochrome P450
VEPPGPTGLSAISAFTAMRRDRLKFIRMMTDRHGRVSRLAIGGRRLILVSSKTGMSKVLQQETSKYKKGMGFAEGKQFFGDGLVTSEGDTWRVQRTSLNPFFRSLQFSTWSEAIKAEISRCIKYILERGVSKARLNVERCIGNLACNILSSTIIGAPLDSHSLRCALMVVDDYVNKKMTGILPEPPLAYLRYKKSIRYIERLTDSIIEHNKSAPNATSLIKHILSFDGSSPLNVRNQTASFLMAGQDNTTSLICWALLLLANSPDVQNRLRESISGNWFDVEASLKIVEDQRYICASIFETMRLFPPVWAIPRQALIDTDIDGYYVSRGSNVLLFPFLVHRNSEDWPDPEKFDPSRFLNDTSANMLSLLGHLQKERMFVPFGLGPRACIGFQHALIISTTVVMALVQSFNIDMPSKAAFPSAVPRLSLRPHNSACLRFTPLTK